MGSSHSSCNIQAGHTAAPSRSRSVRFRAIADQYLSVEQVQVALQREGLESCNLIVAVDFTKSNEWTGKNSFDGHSLHQLGAQPNPYEEAMMIIGRTLSKFDDDQLIPAYGFGDATCQDQQVFAFNLGDAPCQGLEAVVWRYRQLAPAVRLAGPTSFAPAIKRACQIVNDSGGQFHILLLIADGQVTRSSDLDPHQLSPQEAATIEALVAASKVPLAVVMVGVGDGPWDMMQHFDDALPTRDFDNFQFVNFTEISAQYGSNSQMKEAQFALRALMEVPEQYKLIQKLGLLGRTHQLLTCPPPLPPPAAAAAAVAPYHNGTSGVGFATPSGALGSVASYPPMTGPAQNMGGFMGLNPAAGFAPAAAAAGGGSGNSAGAGFWGLTGAGKYSGSGSSAYPKQQQQQQQGDPLSDPLFVCPITQDVMTDPVIAADGYVYERAAIESWLSRNDRSPMSNDQLSHKQLTPNHTLRSKIMEARGAAGAASKQGR